MSSTGFGNLAAAQARVYGWEVKMIATRRFKPVDVAVLLAKVLLIALALIYLAEYFELPIFREAGGGAV